MKKKTVNIKGRKYTIEVINNFSEKFGNGIDGLCDLQDAKIYIDANLDEERKQAVLLHEIMHSIMNECSINQAVNRGVEEILCDCTASVMMSLFFGKNKQFK